jgi:hypothetical protein
MRPDIWASGLAAALLLGASVLWVTGRSIWAPRVLTASAAVALGVAFALVVERSGWEANHLPLKLLAVSVAAVVVFQALEPATGARRCGAWVAMGSLGALALVYVVPAPSASALGLAQHIWLYPARWGALLLGYGAFVVVGLAALSMALRRRLDPAASRLVDRATAVGVLAVSVGLGFEAVWSWLLQGTLWTGQDLWAWNAALLAAGAAVLHAWRRGANQLAPRTGLALVSSALAVIALLSSAPPG